MGLDMIWNMKGGGRGGNTGWLGPILNGAVETGDVKKVVDAPGLAFKTLRNLSLFLWGYVAPTFVRWRS